MGPVVAFARQKNCAVVFNAAQDAVTVELNFMQPVIALRHSIHQSG